MKHYAHPDRIKRAVKLAKETERRGERPKLTTPCMQLVDVADVTSDPKAVTCEECLVVVRESGLLDHSLYERAFESWLPAVEGLV